MKHNREFEIAWQGLKLGVHEYTFSIGTDFMREHHASEEFSDWHAEVKLKFDRQASFFQLHFDVSGYVTAPCDRCGDDFKLELWDEFDLMVKLTGDVGDDEEGEEEADIAFIPRSETVIDISKWVYEFVMLSVPLQKLHRDTPDGSPGCNPEALKLLNQLSEHEEAPTHNTIWKGLEAFKPEEENSNTVNKKNKK
jgi:uncharacterized metal-binding protein YceD (DUF177 family)